MQTISQLYYNINQIKYIIEKKKKKNNNKIYK
jgi:hypothetical protein